ncbi:hypothetical protein TanjilG_28294 [Lupinus angustifolius]|uniref:Transmembrane protein n=1 Tax=Lupinus angustifolius TaxID=3871 RepID=A0A4P1RIF0_LUPAN|nr:hypothetical protein TanjilG_28294 [Lupinus angustifolius]
MERRSTFITSFFLILILTLPYFSIGGTRSEAMDSEIYEIDYRGPETHSSVPPPDHSHGLMGSNAIKEDRVKKVHG